MKYSEEFSQFLEITNPWWLDYSFRFKVTKRPDYIRKLTSNPNLIKILIGARRVGKTSLLYSLINYYLDKNFDASKIIYLNADLREIQELGVRSTLEHIVKKFGHNLSKDVLFVFIDEIQELTNWQNELKLFYDSTKIHFFISGSSATLLTQKSARLTGRFSLNRILPLSLREYELFKRKKISTHDKPEFLERYLLSGGYPEKIGKYMPGYLRDVIDSTLYRDLLDLYGIRQPSILEDILRLLADKITTPVSSNKIGKDLRIDNETAANYLRYLEAVYLIYPLYRSAGSNRKSRLSPPKYYFNDTGVANELGIRVRIGHLAENAVFLELLRRQETAERYRLYYDIIDGQEFDFFDGKHLYEVKVDEINMDILSQYELQGRMKVALPNPIILTGSKINETLQLSGVDLDFIDLYDFLSSKDLNHKAGG